MKVVFYCQVVSPHHLSYVRDVVNEIGTSDFRYVYTTALPEERRSLGWSSADYSWIVHDDGGAEVNGLKVTCEVLISSVRDAHLFETRARKGLLTIYMSERWFKPMLIFGRIFPGWMRLFSPRYLIMVLRFVRLLRSDKKFYYFPMSYWAARDMARMCCRFGDIRFEHYAGGRVWCGKKLLPKFRMWAYFVESSNQTLQSRLADGIKRILWVGRIVDVKRVGDIVEAVRLINARGIKAQLDIYGHGAEENRIRHCAEGLSNVRFFDPVPIAEVRCLMRAHDIYVLSSNAMEGWGAVVNEALEEGMQVVGTFEAGASSTILPKECLYHAGDVRALANLLSSDLPRLGVGEWSCKRAAVEIIDIVRTKQFLKVEKEV